jgi:cell division protein ZipA
MDRFTTPGVSLFLRLPGDVEGVRALDDMVGIARLLATELNGELRDETRSALSRQRIEHLRGEVLEFERKLRLLHARA